MIRTDDPTRRAELAKIHLAKKQLALDDTTYRMVVRRISARIRRTSCVESSAEMTQAERRALIDEFKRLGFVEQAGRGARSERDLSADPPHIKKLRACWLDLKHAGALHDPSERALRAFVARETGVGALAWLSSEDCNKAIESLKAWLERVRMREERRGGTPNNC